MKPTKNNFLSAGCAFLAGCFLAVLLGAPSADPVAAPLAAFGSWLRSLSLGSGAGNGAAWAMVIGLSVLPALGLFWKKRTKADLLLILCGAEIFAMLYYLVNPTRVSQVLGWMDAGMIARSWALISAGCIAGTIACWVLLRVLNVLKSKPAEILPVFLFWTAVGYAFLLGLSSGQGILAAMENLSRDNTETSMPGVTKVMMIVLHVLRLIPDLLGIFVIFLAAKLTLSLEAAPFSGETVALAEDISGKTLLIAKSSLLLALLGNSLQMLFFSKLLNVHVEIQIPLLPLVLCAALMLLCKYFRRAKEVSDDNASIV